LVVELDGDGGLTDMSGDDLAGVLPADGDALVRFAAPQAPEGASLGDR